MSKTPMTVSTSEHVNRLNVWRDSYNPQRGLTISRAVSLIEGYARGEFADLMWLFGAPYMGIEGSDPDYMALIELRNGKLLEMDWDSKPISDIPADQEEMAEEQQEFVRSLMDSIPNLYEGLEHLAAADYRGFSHIEVDETNPRAPRFITVDQWNIVRDGSRGAWKYNPDARHTSFSGLSDDLLIDPAHWIIREVKRPIGRFALLKYIRANLAEKDWDAFLEIYGVPGGIVIMGPNVPREMEEEYQRWAKEASKGGSGALPNGAEYKPNDQPRGIAPFDPRLRYLTEKLILAGTAGKLTMLSAPGSGTLAGGAHADTFATIASSVARKISEVIQTQFVEPRLRRRFPGQPILAYFEMAFNEETDTSAFIDDVAKLSTAGYEVDPTQVEEKTGYKVKLKPQPQPGMTMPGMPNRENAATSGDDPRGGNIGRTGHENDFATHPGDFAKASGSDELSPDEEFSAQALKLLETAGSGTAAELLPRVQEILTTEDPDELATQLRALIADLPKILQSDTGAVDAWEKILSSALIEGLTS